MGELVMNHKYRTSGKRNLLCTVREEASGYKVIDRGKVIT